MRSFCGQNMPKEMSEIIASHDVLEPFEKVLMASRHVTQICGFRQDTKEYLNRGVPKSEF